MSFLSNLFRKSNSSSNRAESQKQVSQSRSHDHAQVLNFQGAANDGSKSSEMGRELFSFPKPETRETMTDYLQGHKSGDVFQYVAVTGTEEESKDSRLARMRSYVSPYGKSVAPEMRINGVILDMGEGVMRIDELKQHVDKTKISGVQKRQNKHFKGLTEHVFSKPYIQVRKITGEFVPLLSGTADYTDLVFSLQDGRLLDHQILVQSNKLPTNSAGVFELSCDYCIPTKDIRELAIRYELARPIMKEGFQWGSVSMSISVSESDTPYLTPKVEAMAIVKMPYTAMEEHQNDLDHKDVTYTATQIKKFRELYSSGDIADNDEPKRERQKISSYSKSSIRTGKKAIKGPEHLGGLEGWNHLAGMKKPLLKDGEASESAKSDDESVDQEVLHQTKEAWEKEQERMRREFDMSSNVGSSSSKTTPPKYQDLDEVIAPQISKKATVTEESGSEESDPDFIKKARKKSVGFNVHDV
jgi:hypothetical protein